MDDLIERARDGDAQAFGELVERTARTLRVFIASFCPSATMIDDLAQETYVRAWEALSAYEHQGKFVAWLRGIARNVLLEEMRRARREAATDKFSLDAIIDRETERRAAAPDADRGVDSLLECLESVPDTSRALLKDFYLVGLSSDEIASGLSRTASWVRVTLLRLRRKLAECVESKMSCEGTGA